MTWPEYLMSLAGYVAAKSKDRSTKVGCVIAGPDNGIRSTGFNGLPRGVNDDVEERHERPAKLKWMVHAEANAVAQAAKNGTPLDGCTAYCTLLPCSSCASLLKQAGVVRVVAPELDRTSERYLRWKADFDVTEEMFAEAGVEVVFV